jgi:hypothetical protein
MRKRILVDDISSLERIDQSIVSGQVRYYYVADPQALIIIVSRCGVIEFLQDVVVDAALGWSIGWHGKCRPEHEGLQLRKVTLFGIGEGKYDTTLSALVAESRRLPRKRPPRGAPWARPYGFDPEE